MTNIVTMIRSAVPPGTVIPKPVSDNEFKVVGWGKSRGRPALVYSIPNHRQPSKPHTKRVPDLDWQAAFDQLDATGELTHEWFKTHLRCGRDGGCNFTTIGGVFVLLRRAKWDRGRYIMARS